VRHYEERGKLEQARRQLRRLLASRPGDAAVRREAERFGVSPAGPV
jgi:hypothetical protein